MNTRIRTIARQAAAAVVITASALGMWGIGYQQGHAAGITEATRDAHQLAQFTTATERARTFCPGCTVSVTTWHNDDAGRIDTWNTFPNGDRQQAYAWSRADLAGYTAVNLAGR